jgi:hypothetical protein
MKMASTTSTLSTIFKEFWYFIADMRIDLSTCQPICINLFKNNIDIPRVKEIG